MIKTSDLPVMPECCKTCPFRLNESNRFQNEELAAKVISRCLGQSRQICHTSSYLTNNIPDHQCKGYYDYSVEIYKRMGLL